MKKGFFQVVSYCLLLSFSVTFIPSGLLHHHHEEKSHCDATNLAAESDPCHVSIYHGYLSDHKCEHRTHLTDMHSECQSCKLLTTQRLQFKPTEQPALVAVESENDPGIHEGYFFKWNSSRSIQGRAPPTA